MKGGGEEEEEATIYRPAQRRWAVGGLGTLTLRGALWVRVDQAVCVKRACSALAGRDDQRSSALIDRKRPRYGLRRYDLAFVGMLAVLFCAATGRTSARS